jgi:predicted dehydrogenase
MMKAVVVGAGFISDFHAGVYSKEPGVTLAGICDLNEERANTLASRYHCQAFTDARAMIDSERPDVVSVCLPTFMHEEYVLLALQNGAHVLCEKPFALTMEACRRMTDAAADAGKVLMVGQVLRWWPEYEEIARRIRRKDLGKLRFFCAQRLQHSAREGWFMDPELGGGALFDLHVHDVDYICSLMSANPVSVSAQGFRGAEGSWRQISSTLRWQNGVVAQLEACNQMPAGYPFTASFRAEYENACLEYRFRAPVNIQKNAATTAEFLCYRDGAVHSLPLAENAQETAFRNEIRAFISGVRRGESPLSVQESVAVMSVIHLIKASLEQS